MCAEAARIAGGDHAGLTIGYLRCYAGNEFRRALEAFSAKRPDVSVTVEYGNHEELYAMLRTGQADMVLNDQRRAFSDEYVNLLLTVCRSFVEVSANSPLAQLERISPQELKNFPCILVASPAQRETEQEYYRQVVGFQGEFLYAENLEEARLMVIGCKGFMLVEGADAPPATGASIARVPLARGEEPILRRYCAFWQKRNANPFVAEFAGLLKAQFQDGKQQAANDARSEDGSC